MSLLAIIIVLGIALGGFAFLPVVGRLLMAVVKNPGIALLAALLVVAVAAFMSGAL